MRIDLQLTHYNQIEMNRVIQGRRHDTKHLSMHDQSFIKLEI